MIQNQEAQCTIQLVLYNKLPQISEFHRDEHTSFPISQLGVWVDLDKSQLGCHLTVIIRIGCLELTVNPSLEP